MKALADIPHLGCPRLNLIASRPKRGFDSWFTPTGLSDPQKTRFENEILELETRLEFPKLNARDVNLRAKVRKVSGQNLNVSLWLGKRKRATKRGAALRFGQFHEAAFRPVFNSTHDNACRDGGRMRIAANPKKPASTATWSIR